MKTYSQILPFLYLGTQDRPAKIANEGILIHCHMGQNRSPSVVTGYLMKHCGMNLNEAFHKVKSARPQFAPHEKYLKQLQDLDLELYGKVSLTEDTGPISVQAIRDSISLKNKM